MTFLETPRFFKYFLMRFTITIIRSRAQRYDRINPTPPDSLLQTRSRNSVENASSTQLATGLLFMGRNTPSFWAAIRAFLPQ